MQKSVVLPSWSSLNSPWAEGEEQAGSLFLALRRRMLQQAANERSGSSAPSMSRLVSTLRDCVFAQSFQMRLLMCIFAVPYKMQYQLQNAA